jgi:hypothetical protein
MSTGRATQLIVCLGAAAVFSSCDSGPGFLPLARSAVALFGNKNAMQCYCIVIKN